MTVSARAVAAALAATAILAIPAAAAARPRTSYYVSLGDSWSQGVQPIGPGMADVATNRGFSDDLYRTLRRQRPGLKLLKLGCGGATTGSMIEGTKRCPQRLPYASTSPSTSQLAYATDWIRRHRAQVAYVTLVIGGNDVSPCGAQPGPDAVAACVGKGLARIPIIARALRRAAGRRPVIVGSTYADVLLGQYVRSASGRTLAQRSVGVFRDQINPTLKRSYQAQRIGFVDATRGFGGYTPFDQTTYLAPYGEVPRAVAAICTLAWYCADRPGGPDGHLRAAGYAKLARLFADVIRARPRG